MTLSLIDVAREVGKFVYSAGDGKVGWALRCEYAEAATAVLVSGDDYNQIFELAGTPVTYGDLAVAVSSALNEEFEILSLDAHDHKRFLINNDVPEGVANYLVGVQQNIKNGMLDYESDYFRKVLGHDLTPLTEAVAEIIE